MKTGFDRAQFAPWINRSSVKLGKKCFIFGGVFGSLGWALSPVSLPSSRELGVGSQALKGRSLNSIALAAALRRHIMKRILYTLNCLGLRVPFPMFLLLASLTDLTHAQVPGLLSYQGRVFSGATAFEGNGQFKFALLNADGSSVYWRNHPDGNGDGQPDNAVTVGVTRGLYSVLLGDSSLPNMAAIAPTVFSNNSVFLRVWFNDGVSGFQQLTPDQRLAAVGYALMAAEVADGAITEQKLSSSLAGSIAGLNQQIQALNARLDGLLASGLTVASSSGADSSLLGQGFHLFSTVPAPAWGNGNTAGAASARYGHTAVWTGSQMVVWGGSLAPGTYSSSGSIYKPQSDVWTAVSPVAVPSARTGHSAIWTGQKMIVWERCSISGEFLRAQRG